jgi:hypothetical protein
MTQLAYLKSENKFLLRNLNTAGINTETMYLDILDLKETPTDMLLIDEGVDTAMIADILDQQKKFFPILKATDFDINADNFEYMDSTQLMPVVSKTQNKWCLANNLESIENLVPTANYLKNLWISDRNAALERTLVFL